MCKLTKNVREKISSTYEIGTFESSSEHPIFSILRVPTLNLYRIGTFLIVSEIVIPKLIGRYIISTV